MTQEQYTTRQKNSNTWRGTNVHKLKYCSSKEWRKHKLPMLCEYHNLHCTTELKRGTEDQQNANLKRSQKILKHSETNIWRTPSKQLSADEANLYLWLFALYKKQILENNLSPNAIYMTWKPQLSKHFEHQNAVPLPLYQQTNAQKSGRSIYHFAWK